MPLDHVLFYIPESKMDPLVEFLTQAFQHVGLKEYSRPAPSVVGLGEQRPWLWFAGTSMDSEQEAMIEKVTKPSHIALSAENIKQVKQFHANALKAGGIDNGAPGLRPHYLPGYYGAFVIDPAVGINFEMAFKNCPHEADVLKKMEEEVDAELNA